MSGSGRRAPMPGTGERGCRLPLNVGKQRGLCVSWKSEKSYLWALLKGKPMKLDVIISASHVTAEQVADRTVCVFVVFRAPSVLLTAM